MVDGSGFISNASSGTVDTNILGTYTIEYQYVNGSGATGSILRTVHVVGDLTPPVVTLIGSGSMTIAQGSIFTDL